MLRKHQIRGRGPHAAEGDRRWEKGQDEGPRSPGAQKQDERPADGGSHEASGDDLVAMPSARKPNIDLRSRRRGDREQGEEETEGLAGDPEPHLIDVRRPRDEGHGRHADQREVEDEKHEGPVSGDRDQPAQRCQRVAGEFLNDGLREDDRSREYQQTQDGLRHKGPTPRGEPQYERADHRRHRRRENGHGLDDREDDLAPPAVVDVLDDSGRRGVGGAGAHSLQNTKHHQLIDVGGDCAQNTRHRIASQSDQEHGLASVTIAQRPPEQHGDREEDEEHDEGQVCLVLRDAEVVGHPGQSRQIEVGGQRREGGERCEEDDKALLPQESLFCRLLVLHPVLKLAQRR